MKISTVLKFVLFTMFFPLVTMRAQVVGSIFDASFGPDNKVYVTGSFTFINGQNHLNIARLNTDGSLDSSFTATLGVPGVSGAGYAFGFFSDGSFLVNSDAGIKNYSSAGVLNASYPSVSGPRTLIVNSDNTFNTSYAAYAANGSLLFNYSNPLVTLSMAKQADGKILLGTGNGGSGNLIRLNANGTLDNSFTVPSGMFGGNVSGLSVQTDGKIIVTGAAFALLPNVFRLNSDGTLDSSFSAGTSTYGPAFSLTDGTTLISSGNSGTNISFDSSGRIVTAGSLVRLGADGSVFSYQPTLDSTFNNSLGVNVYLPISAVPEPSTYAAIFGLTALGIAAYLRRNKSF